MCEPIHVRTIENSYIRRWSLCEKYTYKVQIGTGVRIQDWACHIQVRDRVSLLTWVLAQILSIIWSASEQFFAESFCISPNNMLEIKTCVRTHMQTQDKKQKKGPNIY